MLTLHLGTAVHDADSCVWLRGSSQATDHATAGSRVSHGRSNVSPRGRQPGGLTGSRSPGLIVPSDELHVPTEEFGHRHGGVPDVAPDAVGISEFEIIFCPSVTAEASLSAVRWQGRCPLNGTSLVPCLSRSHRRCHRPWAQCPVHPIEGPRCTVCPRRHRSFCSTPCGLGPSHRFPLAGTTPTARGADLHAFSVTALGGARAPPADTVPSPYRTSLSRVACLTHQRPPEP